MIPGDPATAMLGEKATPERTNAVRKQLGLDRTIPEQYLFYMGKALRGDLGISIVRGDPVLPDILRRFPATVGARGVGHRARARLRDPHRDRVGRASPVDHRQPVARRGADGRVDADLLARADAGLGVRSGAPLVSHGLPAGRRHGVPPDHEPVILDSILQGDWGMLRDAIRHLVLPAAALATIPLAVIARLPRTYRRLRPLPRS